MSYDRISPGSLLEGYDKTYPQLLKLVEKFLIQDQVHPFAVYMTCMTMGKAFKQYSRALVRDDQRNELERLIEEYESKIDHSSVERLFPGLKDIVDGKKK